jgi:predicted GNAT family N-acyltransferase
VKLEIANSKEDILASGRLRYEVYVDEMDVYSRSADHEYKLLLDKQDDSDIIIIAKKDDELIGSINVTIGSKSDIPERLKFVYDLKKLKNVLPKELVGIATRLVVKKSYRNTSLPLKLMIKACEVFTENNVEVLFCSCQPHLLGMYKRLGFRKLDVTIDNDPEFGLMIPIALLTTDEDHLIESRSPLRNIFSKGNYRADYNEKLKNALVQKRTYFIKESDEFLLFNLDEIKNKNLCLINDLSFDESNEFMSIGVELNCNPGLPIIKSNQSTKTLYFILEGNVEVIKNDKFITHLDECEIFGDLAFLLGLKRGSDVIAGLNGVKLISFDEKKLMSYLKMGGKTQNKILLNLSRILASRLYQKSIM